MSGHALGETRERVPELTTRWRCGVTDAIAKPALRGWIHAAATPVAALGAAWLVTVTVDSVAARAAVAVFGVSLVGLYAISALYHVPRWPARARYIMSRLDVAMIPLFIAGTFTPMAFFSLTGGWRTWGLVIAWGVALASSGVAASRLRAPRWMSAAGYLALGWLAVLPITQLVEALPWEGIGLIVLGGALYTLGATVYVRRRPDPRPDVFGFHEVFHLLVVAASLCHYVAIWRYVLP